MLQYRDRQWIEVKHSLLEQAERFDVALREIGYRPSEQLGNEVGISLTVFEHTDIVGFWLVFKTPLSGTEIFCDRWQDVIDLLAYLAPLMLASVLGHQDVADGVDIWSDRMKAARR